MRITQASEFSVVIPEQSKFIKPVNMAILIMISDGDLDLTTYLNELLRTNLSVQQKNFFWFPTFENLGKPEDHNPADTGIRRQLRDLKEKETLNPHNGTGSQKNFLERFDWTDTLLMELEKRAIEDFLVD